MTVVSKEDFHLVKKKIKEAPTFVFSILDNMINGTVYSNSDNLESLLIKTNSGLYYVTGSSSDESFCQNLVSILVESVVNGRRFTLFSNTEPWCQVIEKRLGERIRRIERYTFSFNLNTQQNRKRKSPNNYDIEKINQDHIDNSLEFDKQYYDEYWDTTVNFLQNGFGFCIKENNQIISEGVSIFKSVEYAEIDIITDSNYRGKGLASLVAEQFIEYCLSQNIQPRWDCNIDNSASIQLGNKLGFNNPKKYAVYVKR